MKTEDNDSMLRVSSFHPIFLLLPEAVCSEPPLGANTDTTLLEAALPCLLEEKETRENQNQDFAEIRVTWYTD
ncbi:hypothetical protein EYF80_055268 [Liparis tanakae]|uniref:Uncharacterized protein n=1 Tax=Liparis tanakae TaxID=230148 RepID=A0A4Z2F0U9_9TELE|nr:hypothetical protein EYF80_055268 [Liparis tanakae]